MEKRQDIFTNQFWQEILLGRAVLADPIAVESYDDVEARYSKAMNASDEEFARLIGKRSYQTTTEPESPPELQEV